MTHEETSESTSVTNFLDRLASEGIAAFDGMGTATAGFVIERNVPDDFGVIWEVGDIQNIGRCCMAKVLRPEGGIVDELLVDKQNGAIHFLKGCYRKKYFRHRQII